MEKKPSQPEDRRTSNYVKQVIEAQKKDKSAASNPEQVLRTDMVPSSKVEPGKENLWQQDYLRVAVGILFSLVVLALILVSVIGPGRPILEQSLAILARKEPTPTNTTTSTYTVTAITVPPTKTPLPPTSTPSPTRTAQPSRTPLVVIAASPTQVPLTPTVTKAACRDALTITLKELGRTLCVQGVVINTIDHPSGFMVIFSTQPGAFYWVSYDMKWTKAKLNTCYQITGKIEQIGSSPILIFDYGNIPEACP